MKRIFASRPARFIAFAWPLATMVGMRMETIQDVLERMKGARKTFRSERPGFVPFLRTYFIITEAVSGLRGKEYFEDEKSLDRLDVRFASLYFSPLEAYLAYGSFRTPWKTYLKYSERERGTPFLKMLLGINSHINGDLAEALYRTGYASRKDFLKISDVLHDNIPLVMRSLVREERDLLGAGALVLRRLTLREFERVVVEWRKDAWHNAEKLRRGNAVQIRKKIHSQTEKVAEELIDLFELLKKPYRAATFFRRLHALRVRM